jgi:hypothetical protein
LFHSYSIFKELPLWANCDYIQREEFCQLIIVRI